MTWPIIQARRASAYVSYADTLQEGDVVQCTCCQRKFPDFTREDLQVMDDEGSECVTCQAYICWRCCTYFSCTFKYIHGEDGHWGLWGDWNFCSKSCRARHHWFRAACKVNTMANFYLNSDPYRTYKRNLQNARLCVDLFSRKNTMHPVWYLLCQNFDSMLDPYFTRPQRLS